MSSVCGYLRGPCIAHTRARARTMARAHGTPDRRLLDQSATANIVKPHRAWLPAARWRGQTCTVGRASEPPSYPVQRGRAERALTRARNEPTTSRVRRIAGSASSLAVPGSPRPRSHEPAEQRAHRRSHRQPEAAAERVQRVQTPSRPCQGWRSGSGWRFTGDRSAPGTRASSRQ